MTPATHAAVAALAGSRVRNLSLALAVSFATHFALDAVYHFEAFYPLSVLGRWSVEQTMAGLFLVLLALGAPLVFWLARRDREVGVFACYALTLSLLPLDPNPLRRSLGAILLTGAWYAANRSPKVRRWAACGLAAYLPDVLKLWIPTFNRLHELAHYQSHLDLGGWVSRLATGRWQIPVNDRIFDTYYRIGYSLEILLEGAIFFCCLWLLTKGASIPESPNVLKHSK
jgi:hypothetical protein